MNKWKHDELASDLADHLHHESRMVWTDMQMGSSGSPRPDVFTMKKSYTNPTPISYEIKISRSDFLSDINSAKWQRYLKFSGGVIFAVPKGLITKNEVPFECGLMIRNEETWRTLKRAKPGTGRPDFPEMMKMLIDGVGRERGKPLPVQLRTMSAYKEHKGITKSLGKEIAGVARDIIRAKERYEVWKKAADTVYEDYQEKADQIEKNALARAEEKMSRDRETIRTAQQHLSEILGIDAEERSVHAIRSEITKLARAVSRDAVVSELQRELETLRNEIRRTLKRIDHKTVCETTLSRLAS